VESTPSPTLTRADLTIRLARREDRAALEAIAEQTWDGDDYLPDVLDNWFDDPYEGFYVAVLRDQVVGAAKITRFADDEWWLEGLRVDPAYQGQGLARILHHFALNQVRQMGSGVVRFSTASTNEAVNRLAQETGFVRAAAFLPYGADALNEPVHAVRLLNPDDAPRVQAWLDQSAYVAAAQHSYEADWVFYRLTAERLADLLAAEQVYGWSPTNHPDPLSGILILSPADQTRWPDDPTLRVALLDAADRADAARDVRRLAAQLGRVRVRTRVLNRPEWVAALDRAGYFREWDAEIWLYARDISLTEHADVRTGDMPPAEN
jgi:ribosomal protein S18 acetylase RimI-like enzyme